MDICQKDSCQEVEVSLEKLTANANEIPDDAKGSLLVNGVMEQEVNLTKPDKSSNISHKMAELQVNIDNELIPFENDESSPKLNDALTDEQKIELKLVLSKYFSHEHLSKDKFLISQMDYDQFIPLSIVAGLEDVKRITQNLTTQNKLDAVIKTLLEIQFVQLSDGNNKVRRVIERSTLLLREIPKTVPEKDIREIFHDEDCPPIIACEYAHNDSWYVHFGSEEDASRAYRFLRESGKLFLNKPILARFKGKSALTGSYIPPQSSEVSAPSTPAPTPVPAHHPPSVITVPYLQSNCNFSYTEQPITYYPELYPSYAFGYNASFQVPACSVVGPVSFFYPPTGDQTTVEVINNRQRKSSNRGLYHSRTDQGIYNSEHKQPPRFNRKRAEVNHDEHHSNTNRQSSSRTESISSAGQMSPNTETMQTHNNTARFAQRRGTNRGRRSRHPDNGPGKRHGSDGLKPPSFELETSSFPPLCGAQAAQSNLPGKVETKARVEPPVAAAAEAPVTNRVDQSTTTDGDLENSVVIATVPGRISYAQAAKRHAECIAKVDTVEPAASEAPEPSVSSSTKNATAKEQKNSAKARNRSQKTRHEEGSKDRQ